MIDLQYGQPSLHVLRAMPTESVHCICTSPPYWGLRDYKTPAQVFDGDATCSHRWVAHVQPAADGTRTPAGNSALRAGHQGSTSATMKPKRSAFCAKCNAWRGHLGLEPTPQMFVAHIVEIFREVWRVLRHDGTLWLNLGDSFASGKGTCFNPGGGARSRLGKHRKVAGVHPLDRGNKSTLAKSGLKPKDCVGIPWRVAFALQAEGWYLRQDIIWSKPNPMPESVKDRCTKSHEYLFLLTKSERYFYDSVAVEEPSVTRDTRRVYGSKGAWDLDGRPPEQHPNGQQRDGASGLTRNRRSVWTIPTRPFKGAHFAVFPPALIEPCIKAGTSEHGCCSKCGAPWRRVVESDLRFISGSGRSGNPIVGKNGAKLQGGGRTGDIRKGPTRCTATVGWKPTCRCKAKVVPCKVLDPFSGSGTTCHVADRLGRDAIGIDLSEGFLPLAQMRCGQAG